MFVVLIVYRGRVGYHNEQLETHAEYVRTILRLHARSKVKPNRRTRRWMPRGLWRGPGAEVVGDGVVSYFLFPISERSPKFDNLQINLRVIS